MTARKLLLQQTGVLPSGSSTWERSTLDSSYTLPDTFIVDSPGRLYTRWNASRPGSTATGSRTGVSIADVRTSSEMDPCVMVWSSWNKYRRLSPLIDLDSGLPVARMAENRPGSCRMVLSRDWETPAEDPMSPSFGGWGVLVSGVGDDTSAQAIAVGMYVTIHVKEGSSWRWAWQGWISTISMREGRIEVECADGMSVLSRQGVTLRRNYYNFRTRYTGAASVSNDKLYGSYSMPSGSVLDQNSFEWLIPSSWGRDDTSSTSRTEMDRLGMTAQDQEGFALVLQWELELPEATEIYRVHVRAGQAYLVQPWHRGIIYAVDDSPYGAGEVEVGRWQVQHTGTDYDASVSTGLIPAGKVRIDLYCNEGHAFLTTGQSGGYALGSRSRSKIYINAVDTRTAWREEAPDWDLYTRVWRTAHGTAGASKVEITSVDDYGESLTDELMYTPSAGRFRYSYYSGADMTRSEVMEDIAESMGMLPFVWRDAVPIGVYRIGGGYAQDYLQKIADMADDSGRRRAFMVYGKTVLALASGLRHLVTDSPYLTICRDASSAPSGATEFASFEPKVTIKGRPTLVMVRGTSSQDRTRLIMAAAEDPAARDARGLSIEETMTVSGSDDIVGASRTAWGSLRGEETLEATAVIPGIWPQLIERTGEHAGAGQVVSVYDGRYGLSDKRMLVSEIQLDWQRRTTTAYLTDYSQVYSSKVSENAAVLQSAGDLAVGSDLLFKTQYVRLVSDASATGISSATEVYAVTTGGAEIRCHDVSVGTTATRTIVTAYAEGTPLANSEGAKWDIASVRMGSATIPIPPYRRPDLYIGQTLIVQLDGPRSWVDPTPHA